MYQSRSSTLLVKRDGGVLRLQLNRPDRHNVMNYEMIMAAKQVLGRVGEDWDIRAVVFEGKGEDFCAGDDPEDMGPWPDEYKHRFPRGSHGPAPIPQQDLLKLIRELPKPTIALMCGKALGLGLDLACVCDIRLCASDSVIGDPRILQARHNTTGLTYILPRLIGQSQAMRLLLLGEFISGTEAERIGLVYRSFAPEEFSDEAEKMIAQVTTMATRSYAVIKQQIIKQLDMPYETALMHSFAVRQTNIIEDTNEGIQAFIEKRKPNYTVR
ncbi:MAG: enoyl-CoA hydratase/isomerase family protein [Deltaproteobacteria bacterium]|nr:enoyl-CoA hydratase/isomerase family protein [Deltaproteobacteria bacterium]